ncbi:hypothetical protein [Streptomyces sp. NPDC051776]|uniref:hypothetical protein n=1 Tax=Streptomyces sp. NPDC051776 TaxID=3155414 RepID=UPI003426BCD7
MSRKLRARAIGGTAAALVALGGTVLFATPSQAAESSTTATVWDYVHGCNYTVSAWSSYDGGGEVLNAVTDATATSSSCASQFNGGTVTAQIVCDNASSTNLKYPIRTAVAWRPYGATSCYARFRYSPTGFPGTWGTEYRIGWWPAFGWQNPYAA